MRTGLPAAALRCGSQTPVCLVEIIRKCLRIFNTCAAATLAGGPSGPSRQQQTGNAASSSHNAGYVYASLCKRFCRNSWKRAAAERPASPRYGGIYASRNTCFRIGVVVNLERCYTSSALPLLPLLSDGTVLALAGGPDRNAVCLEVDACDTAALTRHETHATRRWRLKVRSTHILLSTLCGMSLEGSLRTLA
jgi:hypothetical protein